MILTKVDDPRFLTVVVAALFVDFLPRFARRLGGTGELARAVGLVLGIAAMVSPLQVNQKVLRRELPLLVVMMLVAGGLMLDGELGFVDGIVLLTGLVAMVAWVVREGMQELAEQMAQQQGQQPGQQGTAQNGNQQGSRRDPLGREAGADGQLGTEDDLLQGEDVYRRAREILEELRKKSGDQTRSEEELDYFRRLLDRF